ADRFASAREFSEALQGKLVATSASLRHPLTTGSRASRSRRSIAALAAGSALLVVGVAGWGLGRRQDAGTNVVRLAVSVPADAPFANIYAGPPLAISPDGM